MKRRNIVVLVILFLVGCGRDDTGKSVALSTNDWAYASMPSEAVVVEFDGHVLTKRMLAEQVAVFTTWFRLKNPQVSVSVVEDFELKNARRLARQFPSKQLLLSAAQGLGLSPSPELLAIEHRRLVNVFGTNKNNSFNALLCALPSDIRPCAEKMIAESAYCETYLAYQKKSRNVDLSVTDADIQKVLDEASERNRMAQEAHQKSRQKATDVYKRLQAGENFSRLADECSETIKDDGPAGVWGVFELSEIPYGELRARLPQMKRWEYTEPMELEDAIHIVRVLNIQHCDGVTEYTLGRIVIRLPMYYRAAPREDIKTAIKREKEKQFQEDILSELIGELKPVYPSGTNLWRHVKTPRQNQLTGRRKQKTDKKGK